jgi:DNA-binding response OmpR family regulator
MLSEFKILIVEDNPADEQLFKATLSPLSLNIDVARDGKDGYEKIKLTPYDLMILDLVLPNASGMEVLRVANKENLPLPLTIVCSALSADTYIMECLKLGACSYLIKPISAINLLSNIADCLALSTTKRSTRALLPTTLPEEKSLTLTKAMAEATYTRKTGQILVDTPEGIGTLEYSSGKLTAVRFKALSGLHALETLRALPHRSVIVQFVD